MIGSVNDSSPPVLVETEAAALFITGVVARGSAMGMVVTSLSPVDGGKSGVKRAVGTMLWRRAAGHRFAMSAGFVFTCFSSLVLWSQYSRI